LVWVTRLWPSLLGTIQAVGIGRASGAIGAGNHESGRGDLIDRDLRDLIRRMSQENPLWGACYHASRHF
jgi:hypothetical protein